MMPPIPSPPFTAQMERFMGEIRRNVDAAEQMCDAKRDDDPKCLTCPFRLDATMFSTIHYYGCKLAKIRDLVGDHQFPGEPAPDQGSDRR